jgi:hypothetical protein
MKDDTFESILMCRESLPTVAGLPGVSVEALRTMAHRYGAPRMVLGGLAIRMPGCYGLMLGGGRLAPQSEGTHLPTGRLADRAIGRMGDWANGRMGDWASGRRGSPGPPALSFRCQKLAQVGRQ